MRKIFLLIIPFLFFGHLQSKESKESKLIIKNGRPATIIQIESDFNFIKAIYEKYSNQPSSLKPLFIFIDYDHNEGGIGKTIGLDISLNENKPEKYEIITENSRGIWFHELLHYFADQLSKSDYSQDNNSTLREEFILTVVANLINGTTANDFRNRYKIAR